jgi:hypothetical protein
MSLLDSLLRRTDDDTEQLAPDDPSPRGEDRDGGFLVSLVGGRQSTTGVDTIATDTAHPPAGMKRAHEDYFYHPLVTASYNLFAETVLEPGYRITATIDGGTDEEMQEALRLWASNAAIHAGMANQDLGVILEDVVTLRPSYGTQFMEVVGTESDPQAAAALMLHNPATFKQLHREDQAILVQPDDDVARDHPTTPSGEAAAYVQYADSLSGYRDQDAIPFAQSDLVKFVHDAPPGALWGRAIYESIGDYIDSLRQTFNDRQIAIRQTGYAHRIYSSETWSKSEASDYADAHKDGDVSAGPYTDEDYEESFAGRVDFVPENVDVQTVTGEVPDVSNAIRDDIEHIFAVLPLAKLKIAYEEDINQFVAEPQMEKDSLLIEDERQYLRRKFEPILKRKANELAGGDYDGEIRFAIEASPETNPLQREDFPAENFSTAATAINDLYAAGAPPELIAMLLSNAGVDLEAAREEFGFTPDDLASLDVPEDSEAGQAQREAIENAPAAEDAG